MGEGFLGGSRAAGPVTGDIGGGDSETAFSRADSLSDAVLASSPTGSSQEAIPQRAGGGPASAPGVAHVSGGSGSSLSSSVSRPGQFRGFNYAHAASWSSAHVRGWALGTTINLIGAL